MDLSFRPLAVDDVPTLAAWLAAPHVRAWWREPSDVGSVERRYLPMVGGADPTEGFVILADGSPIGYIQRYRMSDEPAWSQTVAAALHAPDAAGIDYFIGEVTMVGRGVGSAAIRSFVDQLWTGYGDVMRIVVAVQQRNLASWRALENAGFRRAWSGRLETDDPGDQGPAFLYVLARPVE